MEHNILIPIQNDQLINYNVTDEALIILKEKNNKLLVEWNGKDFEPLKIAKREVLKLRTSIEPKRKEYNAAALEHQRKVNSEAKRIVDILENIEKPLDDILDAEKARVEAEKQAKIKAEQDRVSTIKKQIDSTWELVFKSMNKPAECIKESLDNINKLLIADSFNYEELISESQAVKIEVHYKLQQMLSERTLLEEEIKKAAQEAESLKIAQQKENKRLEEESRKLAEEQANIKAQQQKLNEEQEKLRLEKEAEEKRKFEEARLKEPEEQKPASVKGITFTMPMTSPQPMVIIPESNEEEKINKNLETINYNNIIEAVAGAIRLAPFNYSKNHEYIDTSIKLAKVAIQAIQDALPNINPIDKENICDCLKVYNEFKNLGR